MRHIFLFFQLVVFYCLIPTNPLQAQDCKPTTLAQLRSTQKLKPEDKEDAILRLGYSFETEMVEGSSLLRHYGKCFVAGLGNKERISYNVTHNSIGLSTYNKDQYLSIKNEIASTFKCARHQSEGFDIYENCSDGRAYMFTVTDIKGKGYYIINIQH